MAGHVSVRVSLVAVLLAQSKWLTGLQTSSAEWVHVDVSMCSSLERSGRW